MATTPETVEGRGNITGAQVAMILGGLVVLLAALWFFFLRGGGDDAELAVTPTPAPATEAAPEETAAPEEGRGDRRGAVETFEIFAPKDPFAPLILAAGAGGGGGATGDVAGGEETVGDILGEGENDGDGGQPGDGGRDESIGGHRVRLIDVFSEGGRQRAQIQVDGTVYTVDVGEVFADNFELVSISGNCATVLFGDDQFSICEGEEILK